MAIVGVESGHQTVTGLSSVSLSGLTAVATGTTEARSLAARFADVFNVRDFGATGDGTTDDLTALNATVTAARAAGGGTIYIPKGVYRVTDTWLVGQARSIAEADMKYTLPGGDTWDYTTAASYSSVNRAANITEPLYSIVADPGTILWGDFTTATRKAILYYSAIGDMSQNTNQRDHTVTQVTGLRFIGQAGMTAGVINTIDYGTYPVIDTANKQVGLAWLATPLHVHDCSFQELDVGLLTVAPYWASGSLLRAHHCNIGIYVEGGNNSRWRDISAFYCMEWGLVLSGDVITLGMYGTEQNVRDVWIPHADYFHWEGGYIEHGNNHTGMPAWVGSTAYALGAVARNNGNLYRCITAGTSAGAGGPTTTASSISDGGVTWEYIGVGYGYVFGDPVNSGDTFQVGRASVDHVKFNRYDDHGLYMFASNLLMRNSRIVDDETYIADTNSTLFLDHMANPTYAAGSQTARQLAAFNDNTNPVALAQGEYLSLNLGTDTARIRWDGTSITVSQQLFHTANSAANAFIQKAGAYFILNGDGDGTARIYYNGTSLRLDKYPNFNGHRMEWAAAAPASGTYVQGDVVWNTGATAGGSPGWVCTTGGTPGTWKAMANVAV